MRDKPKTIALRVSEAEYAAIKQRAWIDAESSMSQIIRQWIQTPLAELVKNHQTTGEQK